MSQDITPAVLTTKAAAAYVGLGMGAFLAAVRDGEIARIADAGHPRFLVRDLDAYLEHKRQPAVWERTTATGRPMVALPKGINPVTRAPFGQSDQARAR